MNRLEKRQQFLKEFIEKGTQLHNGKYDYSNVDYINSRTKVNIICPKHGLFGAIWCFGIKIYLIFINGLKRVAKSKIHIKLKYIHGAFTVNSITQRCLHCAG